MSTKQQPKLPTSQVSTASGDNQMPNDAALAEMRIRLENLKKQKEAKRAAAANDFYKNTASIVPQSILELQFSQDPSDVQKFHTGMNAAHNGYIEQATAQDDIDIAALEDAIGKRTDQLTEEQKTAAITAARDEFLKKNPDCDFQKLTDFWKMDMTPREKQDIADKNESSPVDFYQAVYEFMKTKQADASEDANKNKTGTDSQGAAQEQAKLPPAFTGNTVAAQNPSKTVSDDEYMKSIGLR